MTVAGGRLIGPDLSRDTHHECTGEGRHPGERVCKTSQPMSTSTCTVGLGPQVTTVVFVLSQGIQEIHEILLFF